MKDSRRLFAAVLILQASSAVLFFVGLLSTTTGWFQIRWQFYEFIEITAAIGLLVGAGVSANMLRRSYRRQQQIEDQLRAASGAFMELMEDRFSEWGLTSAERDVALFSVKGMSTQEIAALRDVSEGTIKAQTNAIYRKAGVSGRSQLLSLFIDDLVEIPAS